MQAKINAGHKDRAGQKKHDADAYMPSYALRSGISGPRPRIRDDTKVVDPENRAGPRDRTGRFLYNARFALKRRHGRVGQPYDAIYPARNALGDLPKGKAMTQSVARGFVCRAKALLIEQPRLPLQPDGWTGYAVQGRALGHLP